MQFKFRSVLCSTLLIISLPVHAIIINGTFNGKVTEAQDINDATPAAKDTWNGNIVGQVISGSFWYDTNLAPASTASTANEAIYFSRSNWLGLTFTIDGKTFDISYGHPTGLSLADSVDVVTINNHVAATNGDSDENMMVTETTVYGDETADYEKKDGMVAFSDSILSVLNGIGLEQQFDWINHNEWPDAGNAYFSIESNLNGQYAFANASMYISEIHTIINRDVSLPEPSSFILLLIGTAGIFWRTRKIL